MNNFQELEKEQARHYDTAKRQHVQNNLTQTFGLFKFIGQIVDVYLPALVGVLISSVGGNGSGNTYLTSNRTPAEGGVHPGKEGPHLPEGDVPSR